MGYPAPPASPATTLVESGAEAREQSRVAGIGVALEGETLKQRLMREALEFCHLYHAEKGTSHEVYEARKESITAEIAKMGRYEHTFDELQHGARVAWRNAGKCINRQVGRCCADPKP